MLDYTCSQCGRKFSSVEIIADFFPLCPSCKLLKVQKEQLQIQKERLEFDQKEAERREWEVERAERRERERREQERREEKERREWERREEEERREWERREEEERREWERRKEEEEKAYNSAFPKCKWCGKQFSFDRNSNSYYEYCSIKCACEHLGKENANNYAEKGIAYIKKRIDKAFLPEGNFYKAIVLSEGFSEYFSVKQHLILAAILIMFQHKEYQAEARVLPNWRELSSFHYGQAFAKASPEQRLQLVCLPWAEIMKDITHSPLYDHDLVVNFAWEESDEEEALYCLSSEYASQFICRIFEENSNLSPESIAIFTALIECVSDDWLDDLLNINSSLFQSLVEEEIATRERERQEREEARQREEEEREKARQREVQEIMQEYDAGKTKILETLASFQETIDKISTLRENEESYSKLVALGDYSYGNKLGRTLVCLFFGELCSFLLCYIFLFEEEEPATRFWLGGPTVCGTLFMVWVTWRFLKAMRLRNAISHARQEVFIPQEQLEQELRKYYQFRLKIQQKLKALSSPPLSEDAKDREIKQVSQLLGMTQI